MHRATKARLEEVYQARIELAERMEARAKTAEGRLQAANWQATYNRKLHQKVVTNALSIH
jgi:hypothetical protein